MQIYLLRHAIAEEPSSGTPDRDRALIDEGVKKVRGVLRYAAHAEPPVSAILTSPYLRTRQTAALAAEVWSPNVEVEHCAALEPGGALESVWSEVRARKDLSSIVLVGHEPQMSMLMSYLLNAPSLRVDFKKGALARIEIDAVRSQPHGILRWMITSKVAGGE